MFDAIKVTNGVKGQSINAMQIRTWAHMRQYAATMLCSYVNGVFYWWKDCFSANSMFHIMMPHIDLYTSQRIIVVVTLAFLGHT